MARRAVDCKLLWGMTLSPDDIDPNYLADHPHLECHRSTAEEFALLDGAAELETQAFYKAASQRGDWCY